jgi:hypothetical protein
MARKKAEQVAENEPILYAETPSEKINDEWLSADEANRMIQEEGYTLSEINDKGYKVSK